MHTLGNALRFIFNKIFLLVLIDVTLILVPVLAFTAPLTDRNEVKEILSEGDVYNTVFDNFLDLAETEETESTESISGRDMDVERSMTLRETIDETGLIDAEELTSTIKNSLGTDFLQAEVERLVDAIYDFLDGTSSDFTFSFSLKDRADDFSREFKALASTSLAELPPCTGQQVQQLEAQEEGDFDLLSLECVPPESDVASEINKFIDTATGEEGIIGQTFTEEDVDISSVDFVWAKVVYELLTSLSFILWSIVLGLTVVVIMTAKNIHRGFFIVGAVHLIIGAIMLLGAGILGNGSAFTDSAFEDADISEVQLQAARNIVEPIAQSIATKASSGMTTNSLWLIAIGVASIAAAIVLRKNHVEHLGHAHEEDNILTPDKEEQPNPFLAEPEQPKTPKKKPTSQAKGKPKANSSSKKPTSTSSSKSKPAAKPKPPKKIQ